MMEATVKQTLFKTGEAQGFTESHECRESFHALIFFYFEASQHWSLLPNTPPMNVILVFVVVSIFASKAMVSILLPRLTKPDIDRESGWLGTIGMLIRDSTKAVFVDVSLMAIPIISEIV